MSRSPLTRQELSEVNKIEQQDSPLLFHWTPSAEYKEFESGYRWISSPTIEEYVFDGTNWCQAKIDGEWVDWNMCLFEIGIRSKGPICLCLYGNKFR